MNCSYSKESIEETLINLYDDSREDGLYALYFPALSVLAKSPEHFLKRDDLIEEIKKFLDKEFGLKLVFSRGSYSFDHLFSHRFNKGSQAKFLNALVHYESESHPGAVKEVYKVNYQCTEDLNMAIDSLLLNPNFKANFKKHFESRLRYLNGAKDVNNNVVNGDSPATKNQILYGPPGTGKTYSTVAHALHILGKPLNGQSVKSIQDLKIAFPGQVEFVTFHQSFSYEDFVEGIRAIPPHEDGNDSDQMIYKTVPGVFKELALAAESRAQLVTENITIQKNAIIWKMSLGNSQNPEETDFYETEALSSSALVLGWGDKIDFTGCSTRNEINKKWGSSVGVLFIHYFVNEMAIGDIVIVSDGNHKFKAIAEIVGDYYFDQDSELPQKRKVKWLQRFSPSKNAKEISTKNFTQSTINKPHHIQADKLATFLTTSTKQSAVKNYILIIDEINRGNISRIFGELITLIEDTKRLGEDEALTVQLPYSKESFGVPNNLYIIGTMNTADRSLAVMDTALRRRFDFIEMMPQAELLKEYGNNGQVDSVDLVTLLTTINQRIEALYDREHTIGHAFFMPLDKDSTIEDLAHIFQNKILPLLEEYFYDDWEKIRLVLADQMKNDNGCFYIEQELKTHKLFPSLSSHKFAKSYQRNLPSSAAAYIQIYEPSYVEDTQE